MNDLEGSLDALARDSNFSGALRVDRAGAIVLAKAYGDADRAHRAPNTVETQFAIASGTKGFTACVVMTLVEDGTLAMETRARELLGSDLPLVDDAVTVEHLLAHRSGIGDYIDESVDRPVTDYVLAVPAHRLATTEAYLSVLGGLPQKFAPGTDFAYSNSGYVVLALIAERATGVPFHDLVQRRVCEPAGMADTAFLRSDELPTRAAIGYLHVETDRTNVFHLPVRGSGDGGIYSTVADIHAMWRALFEGRIVPRGRLEDMLRPRSDVREQSMQYGLGFWLNAERSRAILEGYDAGVSFRTVHDGETRTVHTVVSNTSDGAWALARHLATTL